MTIAIGVTGVLRNALVVVIVCKYKILYCIVDICQQFLVQQIYKNWH